MSEADPGGNGAIPQQSPAVSESSHPAGLVDIYQSHCQSAVWHRKLTPAVKAAVQAYLENRNGVNCTAQMETENPVPALKASIGEDDKYDALIQDIALLADMYGCLFEASLVGLRLRTLSAPMCPRFHVDRVSCRLVTTFCGRGTQWLSDEHINRQKLGHGANGLPDEKSGLIGDASEIHSLATGDVALFKGTGWAGNEDGGIVHRSPPVFLGEKRLLLTLDHL